MQTPVELQDSLMLGMAYDGASGTETCAGKLRLPVTVSLNTSASGIAESGAGTLELSGSPGALVGSLSYAGERVVLHASLRQTSAGVTLGGSIDALDGDLPGAAAGFGETP